MKNGEENGSELYGKSPFSIEPGAVNYIDTESEWKSENTYSPMECNICDKVICHALDDEPVCPTLICVDCIVMKRFEKEKDVS